MHVPMPEGVHLSPELDPRAGLDRYGFAGEMTIFSGSI